MKYIMIINKDKKGLVAEVSELLGQSDINIDSINAHSDNGFARIRLFTSNNDQALSMLNQAGFKAMPDNNILVRIDDKPGALGQISRKLSKSSIDIRSIAMIEQNKGFNIVAIVTDQDTKAREILEHALIK